MTGVSDRRVTLDKQSQERWPARLLAMLPPDGYIDLAAHQARYGPVPIAGVRRGPDPALLDLIDGSGLLGRGGAGFPTGRKMRTVAAGGRRPVVVCNGAEGEPASGKDALMLMRLPHLVLDGIEIAAQAVGAREAHLVLHRGSEATSTVLAALRERAVQARPSRVEIQVDELPARYVASEETAVVHWLNGGDAKPTFTPPRPFERGVGGRPTLINNVETLSHVALLARYGPDWYREVGDPDEPGTLLVTIASGNRRHVVEVPTGTTIGSVLAEAGPPGQYGAVLVGGYFGTWLPMSQAHHVPLTHSGMRAAGGALGAAILLPLPEDACGLAETARVLTYLAGQNAGQCGPCVNGLPALASAFRSLAHGPWHARLGPAIDRWLAVIPGRGACRHPDGATRLAASALAVFGDDIERHRRGKPCAGHLNKPVTPLPRASSATSPWR